MLSNYKNQNFDSFLLPYLTNSFDPGHSMTFLDFPESSTTPASHKLLKSTGNSASKPPAERILNRVPPKIEPIRSEVLSRAAAFLPQLAASNRAMLQRKAEDVNIEMLNGDESEVIEMKLGLGVFEEKKSEGESQSETSSDEDEAADEQTTGKRKILVLPSEIRAAAQAESNKIDPFERVINSLLLFDGSTDDESEDQVTEDSEEEEINSDDDMEVLDFE